ncbi:ferritin family protein [Ruminiclostridium cellobioparum]|uniref:ferritin family protein n=1 Tax=Ruminiclostridium cellobioparum TaxID=29355 RepID=UPI0005520076|nr:ferritin family protein [Ruminiclostridium cellobioparum]
MSKLKEIIEYAMRMENDAEEFYSYNMERVQSAEHKKLFEELAEMEKTHYAVLSSIYDLLKVTPPPIVMSWVVDDTSREKNVAIIPDNSELISDQNALSDLAIIRMAYLMESDFALFYFNAAGQVEDEEAKRFLLELADWEKKHEVMFKVRYEKLLKQSWKDVAGFIFK